jgi:hypothetical protein
MTIVVNLIEIPASDLTKYDTGTTAARIPADDLTKYDTDIASAGIPATWVHPRVAINIAQWVSPAFDVAVSGWIEKLLTTGSVVLQRPALRINNPTQLDIEAEILEQRVDLSLFSNKHVLYLAYIGNGLVKLGQSSDIHNRMIKHISSESEFDQFRFISLFEISGEKMEKKLKKLLNRFNFKFSKQVEVFKPQGTLEEFNRIVQNYLKDNDLRLRLRERDAEIEMLKERLRLLEK